MRKTRRFPAPTLVSFLSVVISLGMLFIEANWGGTAAFASSADSCATCSLDQFDCATTARNAACSLDPIACGGCDDGSCLSGEDCDNFGNAGGTYCDCV